MSNVDVMQRMHKEKKLVLTIKKRKLEYLGHITRELQLIMQGEIQGRRSIGRRKTSWLKNLRE